MRRAALAAACSLTACGGRTELTLPAAGEVARESGVETVLDGGAESGLESGVDAAADAIATCAIDAGRENPADGSCPSERWAAGPIENVATSEPPVDVAAGDFDGDGSLDLLAILGNAASVEIWLNRGDGTFACPIVTSTGTDSFTVAVADFNRDGLADFALGFVDELKTLQVFLNQGNGTFALSSMLPLTFGVFAIAAGDFDGDGAPDLAFTNGSDELSVASNRGDGTFPAATIYNTDYFVDALALGDVNGDGAIDIVATNAAFCSPSVALFVNEGDGTFDPVVSYPGICGDTGLIALGDFNGDGSPDVVRSCWQGADSVAVRLNDGGGAFGSETTYPAGPWPWGVLADRFLTTSGPLDIAAAPSLDDEYGGSTVALLPGSGDGTFGKTIAAGSMTSNSDQRPLVSGDFNGDGHADIAFTTNTGVGVLFFVCD